MSTSISWRFPGVQSSLGLLRPCVVYETFIPFTEFYEHLTSLISPSHSMWSSNVYIQFISYRTVAVIHFDGICLIFSILFKDFSVTSHSSSTSSSLYSDVVVYTCTDTGSAFNLKAIICHYTDLVNNTSYYAFMHHYYYASFSPFTPE
jgi:hypothetical protein